jgi:hypothetical protein
MAIAMLGHPLGARQVAFEGALRPLGFMDRVNLEHDTRDIDPIRTFGIGIKEAEVGREVLLIVSSKNLGVGCLISYGRIEGRRSHKYPCLKVELEASRQGTWQRAVIASLSREKTTIAGPGPEFPTSHKYTL